MNKTLFATALSAAMLCAGAAMADGMSTAKAQPAVATNDGSQIVCKSTYHNGAIIKKPTCMTVSQWHLIKVQTRQELRTIQMRGDLQHQ